MSGDNGSSSRFRVGFFGDGAWGVAALKRLRRHSSLDVVFVGLRYPVPHSELAGLARSEKIPVRCDEDVNTAPVRADLYALECDLFVSMSYDRIFRRATYEIPRLGTINCHAGLLPFYRGRNVLNWALINGESEFGITVHFVDDGVDTGDIILQSRHRISEQDDYGTLLGRAAPACAELLEQAVLQIRSGSYGRFRQRDVHPVGSYCARRRPGDEIVDWNWTSVDIVNFVRALVEPGPLARTRIGDEGWAIRRVRRHPETPTYRGIPGAVLARTEQGFFVKTGDSFIEVVDWDGPRPPRPGDRFQ